MCFVILFYIKCNKKIQHVYLKMIFEDIIKKIRKKEKKYCVFLLNPIQLNRYVTKEQKRNIKNGKR